MKKKKREEERTIVFSLFIHSLLSITFSGKRVVERQWRGHNGRAEARMIHVQRGQFRRFFFILKTRFFFIVIILTILHNQEAINLSSLKPRFDAHGVTLHAVVKETLGVEDFRPYFQGEVFLDPEVNTIFIINISTFVLIIQVFLVIESKCLDDQDYFDLRLVV